MSPDEQRARWASGLAVLALAALLLGPATARGQESSAMSERERQRRQLLERLGIQDAGPLPLAPESSGSPDAGTASPDGGTPAPTEQPKQTSRPRPPPKQQRAPSYTDDARPVIARNCGECHGPQGRGGKSRWVFTDDARADYDATLRFIDLAAPAKSRLLAKATAEVRHSPGQVLKVDSPDYAALLSWIEGGARFGRDGAAPVTSPAQPTAPAPSAAAQRTPSVAPTPPPSQPRPPGLGQPQAPQPGASAERVPPAPAEFPPAASPSPSSPQPPATAAGVLFIPAVHAALTASCASCHSPGSMAEASPYLVSEEPRRHFEVARALVEPGSAETSVLYRRARGDDHSAGVIWAQGSSELALLGAWIDGGAEATAAQPQVPPSVAEGTPAPAPAPAQPQAAPAVAPAPSPHGEHGGLVLGSLPVLGTFRLNGRFDLNYERLGYNDHPFQSAGTHALRSYHQFLFLTRQSAEDPVTLSVELVSLQFWEVSLRVSQRDWPVRIWAKAGKLLVPFGAEPLFHHSYGGLAGFDQRVLPVVWAREGVSASVLGRWRDVSLSADAYLVAGYRLRRADGVLNLQSDFAPLDDVRFGIGARLGASWGPLSAWYSPYYNTLGFGRRLFLQALDVAVWRPREVPVLSHFSLGLGLLRGDVSGGAEEGFGGSGADYYHFASYLQLRYYPRDWLYVQYRQGLRTFFNKRGVFIDETDLTREDGSAHNMGVVARWRGLSAGLYHSWNLEKADEAPDDFTRLGVTFEF